MTSISSSKLALKKQQLLEENQQLDNQNKTLKNEISKAEETLNSLRTEEQNFKIEQQQMIEKLNKLKMQEQKYKEEVAARQQQLDDEYRKHEAKINKNVNIINNVKDFKQETVKNMKFYGWCIVIAMLVTGILCYFSLYNISETLSIFSQQLAINTTSLVPNGWNWVYAAISIAIVKLPNALLFIGILAVLYKIFIVLFGVYEKINAEKRKISTIEALINHMNEQSVAIILGHKIDFEDYEQIFNAKADLKWKILSDYFSKSPVEHDNSNTAIKRENKVLREIFLNKHNIYSVNTPLGGAVMEEKYNRNNYN